jgi:hypothetical protein
MATKIDLNKEVVFGSSDSIISRRISLLEKSGKLKRIAPRLYTSNFHDSPETIVKRNIIDIIAWRLPNTIISHRSAVEMRPTQTNDFFVTSLTARKITDLPGVTINVIKGKPALESDITMTNPPIHISSEYRWILEIVQQTRKEGADAKSLPIEFVEQRLEKMLDTGGEKTLNAFRDKARIVAGQLDMDKEFEKLNTIISVLLATHSSGVLSTDSARARAAGTPYDSDRAELFTILYDRLQGSYFIEIPDKNTTDKAFQLVAFFEGYFSNYIEGTKFEINEAKKIVDTGKTVAKRVGDSHDILGTFKLVSNRMEMNKTPDGEEELIHLLKNRHTVLLEGRPELDPGIFKTRKNQAGNTYFVEPNLVEGTLKFGFKLYKALNSAFARAIYMMFICSEIHPFNDGNGRLSRIMMNAELLRANQTRIIVPTVYREDYILSLRRLSRQKDPAVFIEVMLKLQQFSNNIYGEDFSKIVEYLHLCQAFEEPDEGKLQFIEARY